MLTPWVSKNWVSTVGVPPGSTGLTMQQDFFEMRNQEAVVADLCTRFFQVTQLDSSMSPQRGP